MKKRFTKKQLDVMKVLWESATPMIASDIVRKDDALKYQYRTGMSPLTDCEPFY